MLNSFPCTFLYIFQATFPVQYKSMKDKDDWITKGTKIFCAQKEGYMPELRFKNKSALC
jgi:hypothetical protein